MIPFREPLIAGSKRLKIHLYEIKIKLEVGYEWKLSIKFQFQNCIHENNNYFVNLRCFLTLCCIESAARKKKTKRQLNPILTSAISRTDYCDINEDEMRVEFHESRVAINTVERNARTLKYQTPVEYEAGTTMEETNVEATEYANALYGNCETAIYENESPLECGQFEPEPDSSVAASTSSHGPSKNKNYVSLDASKKEGPNPPSVYKRLKRMKAGPKDSSAQSIKSPLNLEVEEDCSIDGIKPKLPTPESSSLSGSSDWIVFLFRDI